MKLSTSTKLDTEQVTALLSQAGKQSNLDRLYIAKFFSFRVDKEIVRQAKLNIKDLQWIWREERFSGIKCKYY